MADQPNILFLASDEHSYRFLSARSSARGGEPCHTPTLDGLIENGANFDAAFCQFPLCTPSRIAMLTGRFPHRCGAWSNSSILDPDIPTVGSHFNEYGYETATIGKLHLGGSLQHAGFGSRPYGDFGGPCGHQHDPLKKPGDEMRAGRDMRSRTVKAGVSEIPESLLQENAVCRESLSWLRENRHANPDKPWLLFASFSRPHFPLTAPRRFFDRYYPDGVTPPKVDRTGNTVDHPMTLGAVSGFRTEEIGEEETRKARAAYFASVDFLDEILGDFLAVMERAGLMENTIVVYTSDHGDMVGEHGLWWKNTWHEGSCRVPLIISLPEHRAGELSASEISTPVSLADIFPSLCGLAGIEPPEQLNGLDLSESIRGGSCTELESRPGVITESLRPHWGEGTEFRMIRSKRYKYVAFRACDDLAFDLQSDPDEQSNLLKDPSPEVAADLATLRSSVMENFDFDRVEELESHDSRALADRFPKRIDPKTPNQILLGNGLLVEADAPLYSPEIVSSDPSADFVDFPE